MGMYPYVSVCIGMYRHELYQTSKHIATIEAKLQAYLEQNEDCKLLHSLPSVGLINATALVCKYGSDSEFSDARHQLTRCPDLRKQLIHAARALLMFCKKRPNDALCRWASRLKKSWHLYRCRRRDKSLCKARLLG